MITAYLFGRRTPFPTGKIRYDLGILINYITSDTALVQASRIGEDLERISELTLDLLIDPVFVSALKSLTSSNVEVNLPGVRSR